MMHGSPDDGAPGQGHADAGDLLTPAGSGEQTEKTISKIPDILPRERVFPIQIGSELFKLSGASISSDGASSPPKQNVPVSRLRAASPLAARSSQMMRCARAGCKQHES